MLIYALEELDVHLPLAALVALSVIGAVGVIGGAVLEVRAVRASREPPAPAPIAQRTGIRLRGGELSMRDGRIRNQDVGIDSENADVRLDRPDIS